jgi:hypothetical protein
LARLLSSTRRFSFSTPGIDAEAARAAAAGKGHIIKKFN